tara:strand:+ start:7065 stop:8906 length:1842 start_codon:yes stop_codon:yes gene_type:complete
MCGIIAIIGTPNKTRVVDGLRNLQNRGYDSAGIASIDVSTNQFKYDKFITDSSGFAIDKIYNINNKYEDDLICIGHTRWATHGPKTIVNSHPHFSYNNIFGVVHNGIIENYMSLRKFLKEKGIESISDTDTEIIVNLIAHIYEQTSSDQNINTRVKTALLETLAMLEGSWGLVITCVYLPNTLWCSRKGSPLLIHSNENYAVITSESSGFGGLCKDYFILQNNDLCTITKAATLVITSTNSYSAVKNNNLDINTSPAPYDHWMVKEIYEQPAAILRTINLGARLIHDNVKLGGLENHKELNDIDNLVLLGCGTSYYAGLLSISYFKALCGFNTVSIFNGADFELSDVPKFGRTVLVFLSQSGETSDLYRCLEIAHRHNIFTIGVVNVVDSLIAREVDCGCYINAGREVSVASTKSFTSMAVMLIMISIWFANLQGRNVPVQYITSLRNLSRDVQTVLDRSSAQLDTIVELFCNKSSCFVLGRGSMESIANEGALKLKEVSYIHAEGYSAAALKHGPFALLENDFPVILLGLIGSGYSKIRNCYEEMKTRGAAIVLITDDPDSNAPHRVYISPMSKFKDILSIIPLQLLAYKIAIRRGLNPDNPRNLAKVVTVE